MEPGRTERQPYLFLYFIKPIIPTVQGFYSRFFSLLFHYFINVCTLKLPFTLMRASQYAV